MPALIHGSDVAEHLEAYLSECEQAKKYPSSAGLALKIGCTPHEFSAWLAYEGNDPPQLIRQDAIKKLRSIQQDYLEQQTMSRYPTGAIFLLKATQGYRDRDKDEESKPVQVIFNTGCPASKSGV